jgi:hypothetical protein
MEWFGTEFQVFVSIFVPRNRNLSGFLFLGMVENGIPRVASIFVPRYKITAIFLLCRMVWNGIPRDYYSSEQREFCWNKPIVLSIPSSAH